MFKFLFGSKAGGSAKKLTQRETVEQLVEDLNAVMADMVEKPKVVIDPNTGGISLELPEQMPDEALALPAPTAEPEITKEAA